MPSHPPSRRAFLQRTAFFAAHTALRAQTTTAAHANVAEMDRSNILAQAKAALKQPIQTITGIPAPHSRRDQFFSELEPFFATAGATANPKLFRAHARALRDFSAAVATLAAASLVATDPTYAARAGEHIRAWLLTPDTRMAPSFDVAGCPPDGANGTPLGVVDLVPLAELARALSFLTDIPAFTPEDLDAIHAWFAAAQTWFANSKPAFIARESKDHRASAWLLTSSAIARFNRDEVTLEANRKRFRAPTLRNQIRTDGSFPQEIATPNPYRNTLFNFDLLAGACQLLTSPFDPLWDYELVDGVGIRVVAAYLYPVIAHPERWGSVADAQSFRELPGRRPALLFTGRAYSRPEYVELWQKLPAGLPPEDIAGTFPIRQPLLWTAHAPHGL